MEKIIEEINKEAWLIFRQVIGFPPKPIARRSNKKSYAQLILENYDGVALILERIRYDQIKLSELHKTHLTLEDKKTANSIKDIIKYNNLIILDIESLYIWSAKIYNLLERYRANVNLKELKRISLVRHIFFTHIVDSNLFKKSVSTRSGIRYNIMEVEKNEILFHPNNIPDKELSKLRKIVKKSILFIPELKNEKNYWEQLHVLWKNVDKISDANIKRAVMNVIKRLGVATDPPEYIAEVLLKCLKDFRKTRYIRKISI